MSLLYLPTTLIFLIFGVITLYQTIINREKKRKTKNLTNEIILVILFILTGILFPFIFQYHSQNLPESTLDFLWLSTSIILIVELGVWTSIILKNAFKTKSHPELVWDYESFANEFRRTYEYDFKKDVERKFLHLLPVFVIFIFWTMGMILDSFGVLATWGLDTYSFAYWLIAIVGFAFVVMFQFADLCRLTKPNLLPGWAQRWYAKSMKPEELDTFVSSAPLVLSFVPFLFAPFPIFAAVSLITSLADAAASLVGKKFGKRKFRENSVKTVEGYIAGASMTFLIVVLISGIYQEWMAVGIGIMVGMALIASIAFFLVDAFLSKNVTDNILNPILTGFGMWVVILII